MFRILKNKLFGQDHTNRNNLYQPTYLTKSLDENISIFQNIFKHDETIIFRKIESREWQSLKCCLILADGMVKKDDIHEFIIQPIVESKDPKENINILDLLSNKIITTAEIEKQKDIDDLVEAILSGNSVLLIEGMKEALILDTKGWAFRAITEPLSEQVVRGPREGFTETLIVNLSLLRRRILTSDLKFQFKKIGTRTNTKVCICYIESLVNEKILKELHKRLDDIEIDGILESGYIEEFIEDAPLSPFSTVGHTERPDIIAGGLLEGRIAILVDGTPFVLSIPHLFIEDFQANEDYYNRSFYATINRMLRILSFFLTTSVPAVYVALVTFHQEMIPTPLILSISAAREGVPFPTIVEALLMLLAFELLRESGVRLPAPVGTTIGFVGAIILGQAAVDAKFVSAPIVIVAALTGITNFLIPKMIGPVIVIRFTFLMLSAFLGLYGYIFGVIGLFIHLMSLRSFGIPYMSQIGSVKLQDMKDTSIRAPWWYMYYRPKLLSHNPIRKKDSQIPEKR
ncbi:spore germination protein [Inediibacterium massiliense]|uniref:spore germination protein n=1 Tax=Inediibacterium massiliense TaxID=1658111 RepID=UPI0006B48526|nr:spore germination protein [Inediibacterium massiliense]